ncbi:MAG: carboxypeptidase-like regulatory domain-containing protein, partial [Acidobacteriota bacterium]
MLRKTGWLAAAVALVALSLWPQYQGRIEGRVVDAAGNPLAGVEVTIVSQKITSQKYELRSDKQGRFTQIGLLPGFYQVTLNSPGFAGRSVEIKVNIAETAKFEVQLEAAAAEAARTMSEADRLFLNGNELFAASKFEEAAASYAEAIRLNPSQWAYHFNLGLVYKKTGKGEEARAAFATAREL